MAIIMGYEVVEEESSGDLLISLDQEIIARLALVKYRADDKPHYDTYYRGQKVLQHPLRAPLAIQAVSHMHTQEEQGTLNLDGDIRIHVSIEGEEEEEQA